MDLRSMDHSLSLILYSLALQPKLTKYDILNPTNIALALHQGTINKKLLSYSKRILAVKGVYEEGGVNLLKKENL